MSFRDTYLFREPEGNVEKAVDYMHKGLKIINSVIEKSELRGNYGRTEMLPTDH